jgi:uncharacterized protein (TIGR02421 family)
LYGIAFWQVAMVPKKVVVDASSIKAQLEAGRPVRAKLPGGGRLKIDRSLPFLCLYRRPPENPDPGTERLVTAEAASIIAPGELEFQDGLRSLVTALAIDAREAFGDFLLVEIWVADHYAHRTPGAAPHFTLFTGPGVGTQVMSNRMGQELRRLRIARQDARVRLLSEKPTLPPGLAPLLTRAELEENRCRWLGIEIAPAFRSRDGQIYPLALKHMRHGLSRALNRTFHLFADRYTTHPPASFRSLGKRFFSKEVNHLDEQLAALDESFDFLLQVTPVNLDTAWQQFVSHRQERAPVFQYRPQKIDPYRMKRRLFSLPIERIEDPMLEGIFREKQMMLDRELSMLLELETPRFLLGSQQLFGKIPARVLTAARWLLERLPAQSTHEPPAEMEDARGFAKRARELIARYRESMPELRAKVSVDPEVFTSMIVSRGNLFVGSQATLPKSMVESMLAHEVGTHVLTYYNGRSQPFRLLALGLAGYDELQEGLAVLAEYLVGGLGRARMRLLGARVVAAQACVDGASFVDVYRLLTREHGFSEEHGFMLTCRVFRGGGLTKDSAYLRGFLRLLDYLKSGGDLESLYLGKIGVQHVPLIRELEWRGVLRPVPLRPHFLDFPQAIKRLEKIRTASSYMDLMS